MPSHLRLQSSLGQPIDARAVYHTTSPTLPPLKKQKMSLTQTYFVASSARSKLGREANRADHNLRRLVGHANLLDSLMIELQDAEREQEAWFNSSVRKASKPEEPRRVQWIDTISEEMDDDSDSDDESEDGYDAEEDLTVPLRRLRSPPAQLPLAQLDDEDALYDEDSEDEELTLTRSPSKHSPPELTMEDESDSEDYDECPSPEPDNSILDTLSEKERRAIMTTSYFDTQQDYAVGPSQSTMVAAC